MQTAPKEIKCQKSLEIDTKSSLPIGCVPDLHPQQQEFVFDELTLDSKFDSGNLALATKQTESHFNVWVAPDCIGTSLETHHRSWFYFRVRNIKQVENCTYTFTVKNISSQLKLFNEGLLPVYKAVPSSLEWKKIKPQPLILQNTESGTEFSFNHLFSPNDKEVYFAFTYPWSYSEDQAVLDTYEKEFKSSPDIYFHRELLAYSREQRRIDILTVTSQTHKLHLHEKSLPDLFPENKRPFAFSQKKHVFLTARVHPGETPASYAFHSFLRFLLSKDDIRAKALRDNFVFVLIPMLNPDGVYRGHYRVDTHGLNLNRYYLTPNVTEHPSIYAAREIMLDLNARKKLFLYCDIHAHAGKKGCFVYGNKLNHKQQVESKLFPKLLSMNSEYFEFETCSFSENNVKLKDKGDGEDKEGAGRVALFKATNFINCFTLECNYNSGSTRNILPNLPSLSSDTHSKNKGDRSSREEEKEAQLSFSPNINYPEKKPSFESYTYKVFEEVGEAIGPTLLDMIEANPLSRLKTSPFKTLKYLRINLEATVTKDPAYRIVYLKNQVKASDGTSKPKLTREASINKKAVPQKKNPTKPAPKSKVSVGTIVLKKK